MEERKVLGRLVNYLMYEKDTFVKKKRCRNFDTLHYSCLIFAILQVFPQAMQR